MRRPACSALASRRPEGDERARLEILPAYDLEADHVADLLVRDIERRGVRRLVIDSAGELEHSMTSDARKVQFLAALVGYLRGRSVTTYITLDINTIVGPALELAGTPLSVLAENLLILRYAEYHGQLHRLFSVIKMRFSDYDRALHEFTMRPGHGLQLLGRPPAAIGLLTGIAQLLPERCGASHRARVGPLSMATILIVDDEQPLRELLAEVLESDGHRVLVAGNGREALAPS